MPGAHDGLSGNHGSGDAPRRHGFHMVMRNRGHTDYGGGGRAEGMKRGRDAAGQSRREKRRKMMRPKTTAIRRQQEILLAAHCLDSVDVPPVMIKIATNTVLYREVAERIFDALQASGYKDEKGDEEELRIHEILHGGYRADPVHGECTLGFLAEPVLYRLVRTRKPQNIRVKTPTYGTVALDVNKDETVDEVKRLTQEWEGHQPGVLMFGSKQLQNGLTPDESTVNRVVAEMACGPLGAGLSKSFVDVSGSSGPRKHALKDNAPDWRSAEPGLCLEGECDNSHCEAYGEMVIVNHGFETFNLMNERTFRCPQCKANSVVPTTCGFFSCRWSFCGRKVGETITLIGQWKEVVEGYHRFDEEQGEVEWDVLRVMAFPLLPKPEERAAATGNEERRVDHTWNFCTLCNATISVSEEIVLPECGHRFHAKCLKIDEGDGNGSGSGGGSGSGSGDVNGNGKGKGKQKAKEKGTGKGWVKGSSVVCPTCREKSSLPLKV